MLTRIGIKNAQQIIYVIVTKHPIYVSMRIIARQLIAG